MQKRAFMRDDFALQRILDDNRNIIYISGHTHFNLDSEFPFADYDSERNNIYVCAGGVTWASMSPNRKGDTLLHCNGVLVEVTENTLTLRGKEFATGEFIDNCYFRVNL